MRDGLIRVKAQGGLLVGFPDLQYADKKVDQSCCEHLSCSSLVTRTKGLQHPYSKLFTRTQCHTANATWVCGNTPMHVALLSMWRQHQPMLLGNPAFVCSLVRCATGFVYAFCMSQRECRTQTLQASCLIRRHTNLHSSQPQQFMLQLIKLSRESPPNHLHHYSP